jgi:hypothetical protein
MQLSDLQTQVGILTNDPSHARYQITDITTELNNTVRQWNAEIKIIKFTMTLTVVAGQRQYDMFSLMTGIPIGFTRVTFKGIDLKKRSKSYFDLYTSYDWTQIIGTPTDYFIEFSGSPTVPNNQAFLTVYPTPTTNDIGANLVVEYFIDSGDMGSPTDVPFQTSGFTTYLTLPYDFYVAYSAAARLLARDPSPENESRIANYLKIADGGKELLINVFKQLEVDEPMRLRGGRSW